MKRIVLFLVNLIIVLSIIACSNQSESCNIDIFNINEATNAGRDYMNKLSEGQENYINAFKLDRSVEGTNYIYLSYKVIRGNNKGDGISLDSVDLKITKNNQEYVVEELKAKNSKEVYVDGDTLRIIDKEVGESKLFLRSKDLPKEIYYKGDKIMINKEEVPQGDFSLLALGFEGNKVAIVIKDKNKEFLAMALVKESKEAVAKAEGGNTEKTGKDELGGLIEKPIVEKIVPFDLIENSNVEKVVFTNDDGELIVQVNSNGVSRLRFYKNIIGELIELELDKTFPIDKYQIKIDRVNEEGSFIKVISIDSKQEKDYLLDLKEKKIINITKWMKTYNYVNKKFTFNHCLYGKI